MNRYGTWVSYSGSSAIWLSFSLIVVSSIFFLAGKKIKKPVSIKRPGLALGFSLVTIWILSIATFLFNFTLYGLQMVQKGLIGTPPDDPIKIITCPAIIVTFFVVTATCWKRDRKLALLSGLLAGVAAPMLFELPFDMIVMGKTYPPIPPSPNLFRAIFFFPLFIVELSTISLLALSPFVKVSEQTTSVLATMFFTFAVWALFGFSFPSSPIPFVFNAVSKILAFIAVITLFPFPKQFLTGSDGILKPHDE